MSGELKDVSELTRGELEEYARAMRTYAWHSERCPAEAVDHSGGDDRCTCGYSEVARAWAHVDP